MTEIKHKKPALSVVVPVYNGIRYIRDTLDSLEVLEKVISCEFVFQNCLSTDGTTDVLDTFCREKDNRFHFNERDAGQSDAINTGVARSKGEWVTWLCADDILFPELAAALKEAEGAGADIVYGDVLFVNRGKIFPAMGTETYIPGALAKRRLIIQQPGTCIRRAVWNEFGGVRPHLNWAMDYDLFMRLESAGKRFLRTDSFLALIRIHEDAKTSSGSVKRLLELWSIIFASHRRRPRYFRFRPYLVYGLEFIIKALEAREQFRTMGPAAKGVRILHRVFWLIAKPRENSQIAERFRLLPPDKYAFAAD